MLTKNVTEELQRLNGKRCLVHQLDPKFDDLKYMCSYIYKDHLELHKLNVENFGEKIRIGYDDIVKLDINGINVYIELKNGTSYYLTEMRNDLREIFNNFRGEELSVSTDNFYVIKDYSLIGQDYETYILKGTTIYDEDKGDLEKNEYKDFKYKIKFDDIREIDEDSEEGYHHLELKLANGQYIEFTSEWNRGDNNEN